MQMYDTRLMAHFNNPLNKGKMKDYDIVYNLENELCGDDITVYMRMKGDVIDEIKFDGDGCMVSIASASLLTQYVKGKTVEEVTNIGDVMLKTILGADIEPSRLRCATLSLRAIIKGLNESKL
jgi:nitrogen fixation NifU-like protein